MMIAEQLVSSLLEAGANPKDFLMGNYFSGKVILDNDEVKIIEPYTYDTLVKAMNDGPPVSEADFKKRQASGDRFFVRVLKSDRGAYPFLMYSADPEDGILMEWVGGSRYNAAIQELPDTMRKAMQEYFAGLVREKVDQKSNLLMLLMFDGAGIAVKSFGRLIRKLEDEREIPGKFRLQIALSYRRQGRKIPEDFADLVSGDKRVKFTNKGVELIFEDYDDLIDGFEDSDLAEKVFGGDTYDLWYDGDSRVDADDLIHKLEEPEIESLRQKLVGQPISPEDEEMQELFPDGYITAEGLETLNDKEVAQMIADDDNGLDDFQSAFNWAYNDAMRSGFEGELYKKHISAIEEKIGAGSWIKQDNTNKLVFTIPYHTIDEWMKEYADENYEPWAGSMMDLFSEMVKFDKVDTEYIHPDMDESYFRERFDELIGEIKDGEEDLNSLSDDAPEGQQDLDFEGETPYDPERRVERIYTIYTPQHPKGQRVPMTIKKFEELSAAYPQFTDARKWKNWWEENEHRYKQHKE